MELTEREQKGLARALMLVGVPSMGALTFDRILRRELPEEEAIAILDWLGEHVDPCLSSAAYKSRRSC